jgi:hypothetical protein
MATYNDYPEAASANAKRALEYRQKTGNPGGCGTPVGWARARQLANKENLWNPPFEEWRLLNATAETRKRLIRPAAAA